MGGAVWRCVLLVGLGLKGAMGGAVWRCVLLVGLGLAVTVGGKLDHRLSRLGSTATQRARDKSSLKS